jgi:hypothetical protein
MIDGTYRGKTPDRIELPLGKYRLEVLRDGYHPYRTVVELTTRGEVRVDAVMTPGGRTDRPVGWLSVAADVRAVVYLGKNLLGTAPIDRVVLPVGRYQLSVMSPELGLTKRQSISIVGNRPLELQVRFK